MDKLQELLDKFTNDKNWNKENKDGTHRFDKEIAWIGEMIKDYAEKLKMPIDRVVEIMESKRDYSWPNYYQKSNFPGIEDGSVIGVFDTFEDYREYAIKNWKGFICPRCGDVSQHPQNCQHRLLKDGKCDWCSYGLLRSPRGVIVLESGLQLIPIFEPVEKENDNAV